MLKKHDTALNIKLKYNLISISAAVIGFIMTLNLIMVILFIDFFGGINNSPLIGECIFFLSLLILGILLRFKILKSILILRYISIAFIIDRVIILILFTFQLSIPFLILEILIAIGYGLSTLDSKLTEYLKKR